MIIQYLPLIQYPSTVTHEMVLIFQYFVATLSNCYVVYTVHTKLIYNNNTSQFRLVLFVLGVAIVSIGSRMVQTGINLFDQACILCKHSTLF